MRLQEPKTAKAVEEKRENLLLNPIKSIGVEIKELKPLLKPVENLIKRAFYMCCNCQYRFYCAARFAEAIGFTPYKIIEGINSVEKICPFTGGEKKLTWIFTNDMLSNPSGYYADVKKNIMKKEGV